MHERAITRRRVLVGTGAVGATALAGCFEPGEGEDDEDGEEFGGDDDEEGLGGEEDDEGFGGED